MTLHVRYEGRSMDWLAVQVGVDSTMSDGQILDRIARQLDVDRTRLEGYVVDRSPSGDVIVRPEAVYG